MARPETLKTDLGRRLRAVREKLGDPPREDFARLLGISAKTLGNYERGDNVPDAEALSAYREKTRVSINWLLTGDGEIFDSPPIPSAPGAVQFQSPGLQAQQLGRSARLGPDEIRRLERAIIIIEQALADVRRDAPPDVKAGMISAAYELLEDPSDATVGRILRLVKG